MNHLKTIFLRVNLISSRIRFTSICKSSDRSITRKKKRKGSILTKNPKGK